MKQILALAALLAASFSPAYAEMPAEAQFLVGTWRCAHAVGDFSGTYTTTYANALGGAWFRQIFEFPATSKQVAVRAEYFLGYDAPRKRWVRFGAHSNGQYFGMVGPSADGRWSFGYVLPGPSAPDATIYTKRSDVEYAIDGPTYPENGKMVTEHHVCKKAAS